MNRIVVTTNKKFAELIAVAISDIWSLYDFTVRDNGSVTHGVYVNPKNGINKPSERNMSDMQQWAYGFLSALKAHCSL